MPRTAEESAFRILETMKNRGVVAGQVAMSGWFHDPFTQFSWTMADYQAGLTYAVQQGWIAVENAGALIRMQAAGEAVAWA